MISMTSKKVIERLRALRKKYGLGEFKKKFKKIRRHVKKRKYSFRKKKRSVFMAKRRKHRSISRKSGFSFAGLNVTELAMMGIGAGFASLAGQQINKLSGNRVPNPVINQAVAGVGLYLIGKKIGGGKYTSNIAKGMMVKTIADATAMYAVPLVSQKLNGQTTATASTGATFA